MGFEIRPVVGVRVAVYVAVYHIRPHAVVECHHRVVAERQGVYSVTCFKHCVDAVEVVGEVDFAGPGMVMVAENERLSSLEPFQDFFWRGRTEEQVADDKHPVILLDLRIPSRKHGFVHLLQRGERPIAEPNDVEVSEMLV